MSVFVHHTCCQTEPALSAQMHFRQLLLAIFCLIAGSSSVEAYNLSPETGTADIGAYHVQPGRCENIERTLRRRYYYFFRQSIPRMPTPQMDSTALCADDPTLTQGYSGNFQDKPYLVYARCLYGRNAIRALCGTTDQTGKPTQIVSPIEAACPKYTRCKNLCATKVNNDQATIYEPAQVQLAQCMPIDMWTRLTQLYAPQRGHSPLAGVSFAADEFPDTQGGKLETLDPPVTSSRSAAGYGVAQVHSLSYHSIVVGQVQKSLSAMGFRKRSLSSTIRAKSHHASSHHS